MKSFVSLRTKLGFGLMAAALIAAPAMAAGVDGLAYDVGQPELAPATGIATNVWVNPVEQLPDPCGATLGSNLGQPDPAKSATWTATNRTFRDLPNGLCGADQPCGTLTGTHAFDKWWFSNTNPGPLCYDVTTQTLGGTCTAAFPIHYGAFEGEIPTGANFACSHPNGAVQPSDDGGSPQNGGAPEGFGFCLAAGQDWTFYAESVGSEATIGTGCAYTFSVACTTNAACGGGGGGGGGGVTCDLTPIEAKLDVMEPKLDALEVKADVIGTVVIDIQNTVNANATAIQALEGKLDILLAGGTGGGSKASFSGRGR